ncbi:MAG: hypothetical protein ACREHC_05425 [Candidatus Levyibacteriota bacterium]
MRKQAVIFADQNKEDNAPQSQQKPNSITISRGEYREMVKEAYKEGFKEALNEKKDTEPLSRPAPGRTKSIAKEDAIKAEQEAAQSESKKKEENKKRLEDLKARQDIELLRTKTVFPFNFFPDTLVIDTTKVTVVRKMLFATESVMTAPLKDISDVTLQTALFLGSITISYMPHTEVPGMTKPEDITITALSREHAIRAKNILKGIVVAKAEEIDIAKLSPDEVKTVIEKFGESENVV